MSDFFKVFLREDARKLGAEGRRALFLGAFGKHPGWNDHIEEDERIRNLGLRTESLVLAKVLLYVQGIAQNIDAGAWEKLDAAHRLETFNHLFFWQANDQLILGRLWSSSDGKGRTRYPMVVAAHVLGAELDWGLATVLPRLERLHEECAAATTALAVMNCLDQARNELQAKLSVAANLPPPLHVLGHFVQHPEFGPGGEGLLRVLYQLERQSASFARGRFTPRDDAAKVLSQDLRAPAAGQTAAEVFACWTRVVRMHVDGAAPMLLLWPAGRPWVDIVLGKPAPEQLFCLRATPAKLPCVSEIPFSHLDSAFRARAREVLAAVAQGESPKRTDSFTGFLSSLLRSR